MKIAACLAWAPWRRVINMSRKYFFSFFFGLVSRLFLISATSVSYNERNEVNKLLSQLFSMHSVSIFKMIKLSYK